LARIGFGTCVKPALFGLLCAWREVLILRQHIPHAVSSVEARRTFTAAPTYRRRDVSPRRRVPAAIVSLAVPRAARGCSSRLEVDSGALVRVRRRAPPPLTVGRRRLSPPAADRPLACVPVRRIVIRWARSNPAARLTRAHQQPLDLDPTDLDLVT
jgi:hypothetical protein